MIIENNNMYTIYCIEDINDLKYVGSTKDKLPVRLAKHKTSKYSGKNTSSNKLNLYNCIIYSLEDNVSKKDKKQREKYWINKIDSENTLKLTFGDREHAESYRKKNRDRINKNKMRYYRYESSWGGDMRSNNNLLKIDISLFH